MKNKRSKLIRVIGGYKCGCTYGPIPLSARIEYCAIHGEGIQNEYDVSYPKKTISLQGRKRKTLKEDEK